MSAFGIKIIAVIAMVIDHIGLFFFPEILAFRVVGRLAFPLFAWLIANGAHYTKNIYHYLLRLFIFGFISQVPFLLVHRLVDPNFFSLNIFFTLSTGLFTIIITKKFRNKFLALFVSLIISFISVLLKIEYGAMGVLLITAFFYSFENINRTVISQILVSLFPYLGYFLTQLLTERPISTDLTNYYQLLSLFSIIFIAMYNHKEGKKLKLLFYVFYPAHLLIIYLINVSLLAGQ